MFNNIINYKHLKYSNCCHNYNLFFGYNLLNYIKKNNIYNYYILLNY